MVVTPLLQQGVTVAIPRGMRSAEVDPAIIKESSVVIAIPNDGEYYFDKDRVTKEELSTRIERMRTKPATSALFTSRAASAFLTAASSKLLTLYARRNRSDRARCRQRAVTQLLRAAVQQQRLLFLQQPRKRKDTRARFTFMQRLEALFLPPN
jgi:hypothetical protein